MKNFLKTLTDEEKNMILEQHSEPKKSYCPVISRTSTDIVDLNKLLIKYGSFEQINKSIDFWSKSFVEQGFPQRVSCELSLNKIRPDYKDKNLIIVDTLQKLIYVFDKDGKFVGKSAIISGIEKQSSDSKKIAKSLLTWEEQANKLGFKWDDTKRTFYDATGKNRKYDDEIIYRDTEKEKLRFLPKGLFTTGSKLTSDVEYAGKSQNMLSLFKNGEEISQAIHGYYVEKPRTIALQKAKQLLTSPTDPKVTKEFLDSISTSKLNLSKSYGCINIPSEFLPTLRKYMVNSYVFNIGETGDNYLVDNSENFFNKMMNTEGCPSPESFGGKTPERMV